MNVLRTVTRRVLALLALAGGLALPPAAQAGFDVGPTVPTGGEVYGIAIGDVTRDGRADVIAGNDDGDDHVSLLRGRGNGTFRPEVRIDDPRGPEGIAIGRFNGDRRKDFAVADYAASKVSIFVRTRRGRFVLQRTLPGGPGNWLIDAADVNGDGRLDIVTGNFDSSGADAVSVHLRKRRGWRERRDYAGSANGPAGLALVNVAGSPRRDIVLSDTSGFVSVYRGAANGAFAPAEALDFSDNQIGYGLAVGRIDDDPGLDAAMPSAAPDGVVVLSGDGSGFFEFPASFISQPAVAHGIAGVDFDRNGGLDLALGMEAGIAVLYNDGTGAFNFTEVYAVDDQATWIESGRLNGDRRTDIVAGTVNGVTPYIWSDAS